MSSIAPLSGAVYAMQQGLDNVRRSAATVASAQTLNGVDTKTLTEGLVGMKQAQLQVEVSAKAVSMIDETLGTLIDVKA